MNDVNAQASLIRELSADELADVSGGRNMISLGPIRIQWWNDGAFEVGIRGVGSLLFAEDGSRGLSMTGSRLGDAARGSRLRRTH